tara:strand:- start:1008 stop:1208 length:201 start_codon:yes stop_codon:yes gene_type:complete
MALYKMSDLAPLAMAEINAIIRLASDKEKLPQCADRGTINGNSARRARRGKQLELQLRRLEHDKNK